jgi:FkbM family methyltransferase
MLKTPNFLDLIRMNLSNHKRGTNWFNQTEISSITDVMEQHGEGNSGVLTLGELGEIKFPYFKMGNIDSIKLFGLDELILFSFYYTNRNRYKKTLDLGANIGLHTLVMKKLGFQVTSYEPDLVHLSQIEKVMKLNDLSTQGLTPKAISDKRGTMEYVRILGNTTGSHLLGSKNEVYGETEVINVEVDDILEVLSQGNFDFVKMDVEGHEAVLLNRITAQSILKTDIMLEIGSEINAKEIFTILTDKKIPAYAQKMNWNLVEKLEDLPSHHTHGSLFLSMQGPPNWDIQ